MGITMLNTRLTGMAEAAGEDAVAAPQPEFEENPVGDTEFGHEGDAAPTQVIEHADWSENQRKKLRQLAKDLEGLVGPKLDHKLASAELIIEDWLSQGLNPVVFCRFIPTANYVGEQLAPLLKKKYPKLAIETITSELPDDVRKQRIAEMAGDRPRVLIAT